jgi:hypothetical protein
MWKPSAAGVESRVRATAEEPTVPARRNSAADRGFKPPDESTPTL